MHHMPIILSAKKKLRADHRKQKVNQKVEAASKLAVKNFKKAPSQEALGRVYSALDIAAKKGVLPKKRVARKKSRLASLVVKTTHRSSEKVKPRAVSRRHSKRKKL